MKGDNAVIHFLIGVAILVMVVIVVLFIVNSGQADKVVSSTKEVFSGIQQMVGV